MSELTSVDDLTQLSQLPGFHNASEPIQRYKFNNANHWARVVGEQIYVYDEMTPQVYVYRQSTLQKTIPLALIDFLPAPEAFFDMKGKTPRQLAKWWYSWSRNVGFHAREDGFLVVYEITAPENPMEGRIVVARCNNKGKVTGKWHYDEGNFIGADQSAYYILRDVDNPEDPFPAYQISGVSW